MNKSYFERIQDLKGKARMIQKRDESIVAELEALYKAVYKDNIKKGCGDCAVAAYGKLIRLTEEQVNTMSEKKFVLKKNVAIQLHFGSADFISNETLTDDVAIRLLKQRPKLIREFEKYPVGPNGKVLLELDQPAIEEEQNTGVEDIEVKDSNGGTNVGIKITAPETGDDESTDEPEEDQTDISDLTTDGDGESDQLDDQEKSDEEDSEDETSGGGDVKVKLESQLATAKELYGALSKSEKLSKEGREVKKQIDDIEAMLKG